MKTTTFASLGLALLAACFAGRSLAETKTWIGFTNDWSLAEGWDPAGVPATGDDVVITNPLSVVSLTGGVQVASLTLSKTLRFHGWDTAFTAVTVNVQSGGVVTLPPAFTDTTNANRIVIVCTNLTVNAGGLVEANAKGYASGATGHTTGYGPGGGGVSGGGGHGGLGGGYGGMGATYDSVSEPSLPGSGGGYVSSTPAGHGGGAIRIDASGVVTLHGTITANGGNGSSDSGGGSGGSIFMACERLEGSSTGLVSAAGGSGNDVGSGGGGGRIALLYTGAQGRPGVRFQLSRGAAGGRGLAGQEGTLYLPDTALLSETIAGATFTDLRLFLGVSSWTVSSLTVTNNGGLTFAGGPFTLTVSNQLEVLSGGKLGLGDMESTGMVLRCGTLFMTNGAFTVISGRTNTVPTDYGVFVEAGDVVLRNGAWIYPVSHYTEGGSPFFSVASMAASANSGFNADARGFGRQQGYGKGIQDGNSAGGGGYGGTGGTGGAGGAGGSQYGSSNAPVDCGSGGGNPSQGGYGGGLIRVSASGSVQLDGTLSANGGIPNPLNSTAAGGSGGGVFLDGKSLSGAGVIRANGAGGGSFRGGGGGGGRIAIVSGINSFAGTVSVAGSAVGGGGDGTDGTIVYLQKALPGTLIFIR